MVVDDDESSIENPLDPKTLNLSRFEFFPVRLVKGHRMFPFLGNTFKMCIAHYVAQNQNPSVSEVDVSEHLVISLTVLILRSEVPFSDGICGAEY